MVLKTTFGESQRWSLIRDVLGVENEEKKILKLAGEGGRGEGGGIAVGRHWIA